MNSAVRGSGSFAPVHGSLRRGGSDWFAFLLLGLLVVASAALAVYTTVIHFKTRELREENAAVMAPTRLATQDLIVALVPELETFLEYARTGDATALAALERHRAMRRQAMARLEMLASRDGPEVWSAYQSLATSVAQWDALQQQTISWGSQLGLPDHVPETEAMVRGLLVQATLLQRAITDNLETARARIDAAEELDWLVTLALVLLTLFAALFITLLIRRVRRLAWLSERRRVEAETAIADRAQLIRGITHDVKNPLGAADGSAQLLELGIGGELTASQREAVARIRRGIDNALAIVADLLEMSRAESRELSIAFSPTNIRAVIDDLVADYRSQAESAGLTLEYTTARGIPEPVTDGHRVREIIGNLLSNAIKFTPAGGRVSVDLGASADEEHAQGRWLVVRVADTGPGIAAEEQENIFVEFYRAGGPGPRPPGAGVGLAISRRLARLLGGDLRVRSQPGRGSVFTLLLPLDTSARTLAA